MYLLVNNTRLILFLELVKAVIRKYFWRNANIVIVIVINVVIIYVVKENKIPKYITDDA